ncbi:hypothetical protein DL98DRAFT_267011 [Cadophora sp. DSE1049]|nr:hypothetical protein DL98DRAFT_267011 [Cadophora sp. DSE1049]
MSYNDPCGYEWLSSTPSSPAYPSSPPTTAAEVHELMIEVEKKTPRRWSQSPNSESVHRQYHHLTTNLRQTVVQNIDTAEYAGMPTSQRTFTCFARLPAEARRRIWCNALPGPWIVGLEKRYLLNAKGSLSWQYIPENPRPLLQTCKESRTVARRNYGIEKWQNKLNKVPSTPWIRYDHDIVHIRDLDFSLEGNGYVWYDEKRAGYTNGDEYSFEGRPDCFDHFEALAVTREILEKPKHRTAYLLRSFFPKLRVLVILIDDEVDFDEVWPEYGSECGDDGPDYESGDEAVDDPDDDSDDNYWNNNTLPRVGFTTNCAGPFSEVCKNEEYASEVQSEVLDMLEEESTLCFRYYVPEVLVRAASFKPGKVQAGHETFTETNDPEDPDQSDADSFSSDASSLPPPARQDHRVSFNTSQQQAEDFHDTVRQVKINLTGAMLDFVNTSIHTQMQLPSFESSQKAPNPNLQQPEVLPAGNASSRPQAAQSAPPRPSKKQEKPRKRRAKSKAKKRQGLQQSTLVNQ